MTGHDIPVPSGPIEASGSTPLAHDVVANLRILTLQAPDDYAVGIFRLYGAVVAKFRFASAEEAAKMHAQMCAVLHASVEASQ